MKTLAIKANRKNASYFIFDAMRRKGRVIDPEGKYIFCVQIGSHVLIRQKDNVEIHRGSFEDGVEMFMKKVGVFNALKSGIDALVDNKTLEG